MTRGFTVIEVLIVLACLGVIAGGVWALSVLLVTDCRPHGPSQAKVDARTIHPIAEKYRVDHPETCPTVEVLVAIGEISPHARREDPWGKRYEIFCDEDDILVLSSGPDRKLHTADDIRVPGG